MVMTNDKENQLEMPNMIIWIQYNDIEVERVSTHDSKQEW